MEKQPFEPKSEEEYAAVTPLDLLDGRNYTTKDIRDKRLEICKGCVRFHRLTHSCQECHCFMPLKTWLSEAECPINKWGRAVD